VEVWSQGRLLDAGPPQRRTVLAALLADPERWITTQTLVDRVWERAPDGARRALHVHLSHLRKMLRTNGAGDIAYRSGGYQLRIDPEQVDWYRFRTLVRAAEERHGDERASVLADALSLWRGLPLADLPGDWAARTRANWRQQHLDAAVRWCETELTLGRHENVIASVRELVTDYPLAEPLIAVQLRALVAAGRQAEALDCYAACRARLVEELGTEPGPQLRALHQDMLHAADNRPTWIEIVRPAQLPPDIRGFAGREGELSRLDAAWRMRSATAPVIVAVCGTAGVGKTTLVLHWGHQNADRFPDGQLYVNLRGFDPGATAMTAATAIRGFLDALGVEPKRVPLELDGQTALYRSMLAGKTVVVVLDNARDADQVRPLLPGSASAMVLVTSRNRLTQLIAGNNAVPLPVDTLSLADSRRLLAARVGQGSVAAEPEAARQIFVACAGLPLALSIAAAKAQQSGFSLSRVAATLGDLDQRLDALDTGDDPTSQIRSAFSWSYATLDPAAARLFRVLGLHPGPDIDPAAAASLASEPLSSVRRNLSALVGAHLLAEHRPDRYEFHDLLRAYARDLAASVEPTEQREAATTRLIDHYLHTASAADTLVKPHRYPSPLPLATLTPGTQPESLRGREQALAWFAREQAVFPGLVRLTAQDRPRLAFQLAWAFDTFLERQGLWEMRTTAWGMVSSILDAAAPPSVEATVHRILANTHNLCGRHTQARYHNERALDLYGRGGDLVGQAAVHTNLAYGWECEANLDRALQHGNLALKLSRLAGDKRAQALSLNSIGWYQAQLGNPALAAEHCREALALLKEIGDENGEAAVSDSLGYALHSMGRHAEAARCYESAVELYQRLGDRYYEADTLVHLGDAFAAQGQHTQATAKWRQALQILDELGHSESALVRERLNR
jgi:DNA-binding SARP family transcriptional activator/tetratricopeptide (TPR) repeat protein